VPLATLLLVLTLPRSVSLRKEQLICLKLVLVLLVPAAAAAAAVPHRSSPLALSTLSATPSRLQPPLPALSMQAVPGFLIFFV
jgi:hypothetical protein